MPRRILRLYSLILVLSAVSCRWPPIGVGVVFPTSWTLDTESLNDSDKSLVKRNALETLRRAYAGFDVRFVEGASGSRLIRVENRPQVSDPRQFGAAGATYAISPVSWVYVNVLLSAEMAAVDCPDLSHCTKTRTELLEGLGRGIGATAAHELGHQIGFRFTHDVQCDDCYDGNTSTSYNHFFGNSHWSDRAREIMTKVLPSG